MRVMLRVGLVAAIILLACVALFGCGGTDGQDGLDGSTAVPSESPGTDSTEAVAPAETDDPAQDEAQTETEVVGMPAGFPSDVPVHPGTVTGYEPMEVTESTTVHQLTVESTGSFDEVLEWYDAQLPSGWSVGFCETEGDDGSREGKIALDGGSYAPAAPDGLGGGVIIGVFEGDKTRIVTTVTVMAP